MAFFRIEAMRSVDRLHGDVDLSPPTSWSIVAAGIVAAFVLAIAFLSLATYSRQATATGVIESDLGRVDVSDRLGGVVADLHVAEGTRVRRGDELATISHDTNASDGASLEARRADALTRETAAIVERAGPLARAADARIAGLRADIAAAAAEASAAESQMERQSELIEAARQDLDKARSIAENGFVSQQDVRRREETYATRLQAMDRLRQQRAQAVASADRARSDIARERAQLSADVADVDARRADAERRANADDAARRTVLRASSDGTVTGVAIARGERLAPGAVAMTIIPAGGRLRARLVLPDAAAASVAPGQTVRLAVDAFPLQTYGTMPTTVARVTPGAVPTDDGARFVAWAELPRASIDSYGAPRPLRPGMTVTARVRTMRRTLLQWLLDPFYAVARR